MTVAAKVTAAVRAALEREPRVNLHAAPVALSFTDGVLTMEGEADSIAAKKLALELAAAHPEVHGIVDRLHVRPAARQADGAVRDAVVRALMQEPAFTEIAIRAGIKGHLETAQGSDSSRREIRVDVAQGVVTLSGEVPGLSHKRLAGVLAWWVPGSRDVINGLEVAPPEADSDAEITDAVRLVLEKDPFVNAGQILVGTHNAVVTLRGQVPMASESEMAEFDAWYVFGVDGVINEIRVAG